MSVPFEIIKKAGHEDRFIFQGTLIDDFLSAQTLRNFYFGLIGQEYKINQTYCKEFSRKDSLINECKRLIRNYITSPKEWIDILDAQEKERIEREKREKREKKKAAVLAVRKALISEKVKELSVLSIDEFEILQIAMVIASGNISGTSAYERE